MTGGRLAKTPASDRVAGGDELTALAAPTDLGRVGRAPDRSLDEV